MSWWFWLTMFFVSTSLGVVFRFIEPEYSTRGKAALRVSIGVGIGCLLLMMGSIRYQTWITEQEAALQIQGLRSGERARDILASRRDAVAAGDATRRAQREANYAAINDRLTAANNPGAMDGRGLYLRYCKHCHDTDGAGMDATNIPPIYGLGGRDRDALSQYLSTQHNVVGLDKADRDNLTAFLLLAFAEPPPHM